MGQTDDTHDVTEESQEDQEHRGEGAESTASDEVTEPEHEEPNGSTAGHMASRESAAVT